jgi:hypothetical protein
MGILSIGPSADMVAKADALKQQLKQQDFYKAFPFDADTLKLVKKKASKDDKYLLEKIQHLEEMQVAQEAVEKSNTPIVIAFAQKHFNAFHEVLVGQHTEKNLGLRMAVAAELKKIKSDKNNAKYEGQEILKKAAEGFAVLGQIKQSTDALTMLERDFDYRFTGTLEKIEQYIKNNQGDRSTEEQKKETKRKNHINLVIAALGVPITRQGYEYDHSSRKKQQLLDAFDNDEDAKIQVIDGMIKHNAPLDAESVMMLVEHAQPDAHGHMAPSQKKALEVLVAKDGVNILSVDAAERIGSTYSGYRENVVREFYQHILARINQGLPAYLDQFLKDTQTTEHFLESYNTYKDKHENNRLPTTVYDLIKGEGAGPAKTSIRLGRNVFNDKIRPLYKGEQGEEQKEELEKQMRILADLAYDVLNDDRVPKHDKQELMKFVVDLALIETVDQVPKGQNTTDVLYRKVSENGQDISIPVHKEGFMLKAVQKLKETDPVRKEIQDAFSTQWRGLCLMGDKVSNPGDYVEKLKL